MSFAVPYARTRWDEIVPGLFQGGHDFDELRKFSSVCPVIVTDEFDLVVSLYKRWGHGPDDHVRELRCQVPDGDLLEKVLVRCQAGYNRSGLVVALVLLRMGFTADDAIERIRKHRSEHALCNEVFVQYIKDAWEAR